MYFNRFGLGCAELGVLLVVVSKWALQIVEAAAARAG